MSAAVWEWVGLSVLGALGMFFTWLSGKQGRDHAERLALIGNEHAARMVREERTHQRLADTYVALLDMAERVGMWAQAVRPLMDTDPPQPVPPLPDLAEQATVRHGWARSAQWRFANGWRSGARSCAT